jgi:hypothetical protein
MLHVQTLAAWTRPAQRGVEKPTVQIACGRRFLAWATPIHSGRTELVPRRYKHDLAIRVVAERQAVVSSRQAPFS